MHDLFPVERPLKARQRKTHVIHPNDVRFVKHMGRLAVTEPIGMLGHAHLPIQSLVPDIHNDEIARPRRLVFEFIFRDIDTGPAHFDDSALHMS